MSNSDWAKTVAIFRGQDCGEKEVVGCLVCVVDVVVAVVVRVLVDALLLVRVPVVVVLLLLVSVLVGVVCLEPLPAKANSRRQFACTPSRPQLGQAELTSPARHDKSAAAQMIQDPRLSVLTSRRFLRLRRLSSPWQTRQSALPSWRLCKDTQPPSAIVDSICSCLMCSPARPRTCGCTRWVSARVWVLSC